MGVGKSKEDYLEAILILTEQNGDCRASEIARQLGFSKPSVSTALARMEKDGYVVRDGWKILLTETGLEIAQKNLAKHRFFTGWLMKAGVDPDTAQNEACLMEHTISYDSYQKIAAYLRKMEAAL